MKLWLIKIKLTENKYISEHFKRKKICYVRLSGTQFTVKILIKLFDLKAKSTLIKT